MLEMGIVVGLGLLFTLWKMPWTWKLRVLSNPLLTDAIVFVFLIAIHWGTFSGVMVASVGALFCSMTLSLGRWLIGFNDKSGRYVPGKIDVSPKLGVRS